MSTQALEDIRANFKTLLTNGVICLINFLYGLILRLIPRDIFGSNGENRRLNLILNGFLQK